jgi:hypothetical protein
MLHHQPTELQGLDVLEKYILIFILIFTIFGNVWVLIVILRERNRQAITNFIASLAVADLLTGIFVLPIRLHRLLNIQNGGITSSYLCYFYMWIGPFAETASVYTLTFISFDRCLKVSKPVRYKSRMTTSTLRKLILVICCISTLHGFFGIFSYERSSEISLTEFGCVGYDKMFYIFAADSTFFLHIAIMFFMYILTVFIAHERQKLLANGTAGNDRNHQRRAALRQDLKVIRIFLVVVAMFIICKGPFFIWLTLSYHYPSLLAQYSVVIERGVLLLSLSNSLCNPIIYGCLDQKFAGSFKQLQLFSTNNMLVKATMQSN